MKTQKQRKLKVRRHKRFISAVLVVCVVMVCAMLFTPRNQRLPQDLGSGETEEYIVGKVSAKAVSDQYTPVLLYTITSNGMYFLGSGTYVHGKSGDQVVTADHVFSPDQFHGDTAIGVRALRPMDMDVTMALNGITMQTLGDRDIAAASVRNITGRPAIIHRYSRFGSSSTNRTDPCIEATLPSGKKITKLQSLITGKWYDIVGTHLAELAPNVPTPVCINYSGAHGESGSGFQDEEGSLYVVSTIVDQHQSTWQNLKDDIRKIYRKKVHGVTTVYGPLKIAH